MPEVSVLVPVYNMEKYLPECLDSLVNQSLSDIEIICINDGSTDSSLQILEKYAAQDNRIKIINKENSGYGASMNVGLRAAKGKYIGILESDDFADKNMFEDLFNLAEENHCDFVKSDWYNYYSNCKETGKAGVIKNSHKVFNLADNISILRWQPTIWSALYNRNFLEKNNICFLETPGASFQDTSFHLKVCLAAERILTTSNAYVRYRKDNENASCKSKSKVFEVCKEYETVEKYIKERPLLEKFSEYVYVSKYCTYIWNLNRITDECRLDFLKEFAKEFKNAFESEILKDFFFRKINRNEFMLLINNQQAFLELNDKLEQKRIHSEKRRRMFSIHLNPKDVRIVLFGKQIVEIS